MGRKGSSNMGGGGGRNAAPSGNESNVGKVPEGAGRKPDLNREVTARRLNDLDDFAVQYQRDHRAELKQYGIKRSGFISNWKGIGGVHVWGFEGDTKNGSTWTTVLNNGFATTFYTKGMNRVLGTKMYNSLDSAIGDAKKYLGRK
jgi:hypothetical protein